MSAASILQAQTAVTDPTSWAQNLAFNQFDPALGALQSVDLGLTGSIYGSVWIENLQPTAAEISLLLSGVISVGDPTGGILAGVAPAVTETATLGGFDGSAGQAGSSAARFDALSAVQSSDTVLLPGTTGIDGFVGTGTVSLPVTASSSLTVDGPANMQVLAHTSSGAVVTLDYNYGTPAGGGSGSDAMSGLTMVDRIDYGPPYPSGGPCLVTTAPQVFNFADRTTGWNDTAMAAQFNPSLGRLVSVGVTLSDGIVASLAAENLGGTAASVTSSQDAQATLRLPTQWLIADAVAGDSMALGAYDGAADYAGGSGRIDQNLTQSATSSLTLSSPADLAGFLGQGSVVLPISVDGTATLSGPGNLDARLLAEAGASVSISYTYQPAPVIGGGGNRIEYAAGQAATVVDPTLTLTDLYSTTLIGASVTISDSRAGDILGVDTAGTGVTGIYDAATQTLTLSGAAGLAAYQQVLRSVTYESTTDQPFHETAGPRTLAWSVTDDQGATSMTATSTVDVPVLDRWTSVSSGTWDSQLDWSSAPHAPSAAQDVAIVSAEAFTIDVTAAASVNALLLDAPHAVLKLDAPLDVAAGFTLLAGTLEFANHTTLAVGSYEQDGGTMTGNPVNIASHGTIAVNGGTVVSDSINFATGQPLSGPGSLASIGTLVAGTGTLVAGSIFNVGPTTPPNVTIGPAGTLVIDSAPPAPPVTVINTDTTTVSLLPSGEPGSSGLVQPSGGDGMGFIASDDVQCGESENGTAWGTCSEYVLSNPINGRWIEFGTAANGIPGIAGTTADQLGQSVRLAVASSDWRTQFLGALQNGELGLVGSLSGPSQASPAALFQALTSSGAVAGQSTPTLLLMPVSNNF